MRTSVLGWLGRRLARGTRAKVRLHALGQIMETCSRLAIIPMIASLMPKEKQSLEQALSKCRACAQATDMANGHGEAKSTIVPSGTKRSTAWTARLAVLRSKACQQWACHESGCWWQRCLLSGAAEELSGARESLAASSSTRSASRNENGWLSACHVCAVPKGCRSMPKCGGPLSQKQEVASTARHWGRAPLWSRRKLSLAALPSRHTK